MHLIVGTAGHIDHGKTALVKALTGIDADRLPEEKQRGITIDLGFAELDLGDLRVGFVDVPGHERFVKNMLAGASGIDIVLLVIAADEGVMPQTREHFDICRLLEIKKGLVVLTKSDLVDAETLELAMLDAGELVTGSFLEGAPVIAVSSRSGDGIEVLRDAIKKMAAALPDRKNAAVARLSIDRSFSVKGFGSVVTGTLASGEIDEGAELEILPAGRRVRVRGLQTHGRSVTKALAGQRTAVNLGSIDHTDIHRGMLLAEAGTLQPIQIVDAEVEVLKNAARPLRSRQRVRVHIGTSEVLARVNVLNEQREIESGKRGLVQLSFESPVLGVLDDRFIIRSYSPQVTIGGGSLLLSHKTKHRSRDLHTVSFFLKKLVAASGDLNEQVNLIVKNTGEQGCKLSALQTQTGLRADVLRRAVDTEKAAGTVFETAGVLLSDKAVSDLKTTVVNDIERHHKADPLSRGMLKEVLRERRFKGRPEIFQFVINELERAGMIAQDRDVLRLATHRSELSGGEGKAMTRLKAIYSSAGLEVPKLDEALADASAGSGLDRRTARKVFQLLLDSKELLQVNDEFFFEKRVIDRVTADVRKYADASPDRVIDVPKFKEIAGISRKYAIPLLEFFDRTKITQRVGEKRIVRK